MISRYNDVKFDQTWLTMLDSLHRSFLYLWAFKRIITCFRSAVHKGTFSWASTVVLVWLEGVCLFVCFCVTQHLHGLSFSLHLSGVYRGSMEALFLMSSCECLRCLLKQHGTTEWRNCSLFLSACVHKRLFQRHPRTGAPLDADAVKWRVIWVTFATTKARLSEMISSWFQFQETTLPSVSIIHVSVKQDVTLPSSDEITWEISALHWLKSHQDPCTVAFFSCWKFLWVGNFMQ